MKRKITAARLPHFEHEHALAERLKTPQALETYEKLALGASIKKIRKKTGMKQSELAKKLKTSQSVIARIENGKQNVSLRVMVMVARVLDKKLIIRFL